MPEPETTRSEDPAAPLPPSPTAVVPPQPVGGEGGAPAPVGAGSPAGSPEGGSDSPPAPPHRPEADWRDKRIAQLTAQLKDARRATAAAPPADPAASPPDAAAIEAEVDRRASAKAAEQEFLRRCDDVQQTGISEFGKQEWDSRVTSLRQLVNQDNQGEVVAWNGLLIAAMETGEGAKILHELGQNLNEAQRILSLPAVRMTVELTKMAGKLAEADPADPARSAAAVSGAPRPIRPVGSRGPSHVAISPDDPERAHTLDIDVWMQRRAAQVKERGIR